MSHEVDELLARSVTEGGLPGVIAMATDGTESLYEGAFGERTLGGGASMSRDTVIWFASMTKALTAVAVMQLVEQGKLALDRPAGEVLPALGKIQVFEGLDKSGTPRLRPPAESVTLRKLLTHTAGFGYETWNPEAAHYQEALGIPGMLSCSREALRAPLIYDPGERWNYGIGIDWAGQMLEEVSGKTLGVYLRDHLFEPLGMTDTAFRISPDMRARLAKVHQRDESGRLKPIDLEINQDPEIEGGGGALYGTVGDYMKFIRMMLNGGKSERGEDLLTSETVAQMSRNQMGTLRVKAMKSRRPSYSNDFELFPGLPKTWGLSFLINEEEAPTGRGAGSLCWAGIANSYFWIDPKRQVGGVLATQILPFGDEAALSLALDFEKAVYASLT